MMRMRMLEARGSAGDDGWMDVALVYRTHIIFCNFTRFD